MHRWSGKRIYSGGLATPARGAFPGSYGGSYADPASSRSAAEQEPPTVSHTRTHVHTQVRTYRFTQSEAPHARPQPCSDLSACQDRLREIHTTLPIPYRPAEFDPSLVRLRFEFMRSFARLYAGTESRPVRSSPDLAVLFQPWPRPAQSLIQIIWVRTVWSHLDCSVSPRGLPEPASDRILLSPTDGHS